MKTLQLFDQNHGLSTLLKCQFCLLFKSMFILSRKACLLTRTSPITFFGCILHKTKRLENFEGSTKTMDHGPKPWTLGKNANFVGFWNPCFSCSERLVCYIKRRKSVFHDLFWRSMTWEYKGLQGITGGYKGVTRGYIGLQGVTRGYRGLQGVTRGDRGWQGVTGGYKGL